MSADPDIAELERLSEAFVTGMLGDDPHVRRSLWDRDDPDVLHVPEEAPHPFVGWDALETYWGYTTATLTDIRSTAQGRVVVKLSADIASVTYAMTWRATFVGGAYDGMAVAGDNRVTSLWRRRGDSWRIFHILEAPLSPLRHIRLESQAAYRRLWEA
jgi:ketosteroid isomerase-like protein